MDRHGYTFNGVLSTAKAVGVTVEEKERGRLAGYVSRVVDNHFNGTTPRFSNFDYHSILRAAQPADERELDRRLDGFPLDWADAYRRHNKIVRNARGESETVPRIPGVENVTADGLSKDEVNVYRAIDELTARRKQEKLQKEKDGRRPRYFLRQVLTDTTLWEKFKITEAMLSAISKLSVRNPVLACDTVRRHVADLGHDVDIAPGDYARGRKAATRRITEAAEGLYCEDYNIVVLPTDIFMVTGSSPGDPSGSWTLEASAYQARELHCLYKIGKAHGGVRLGQLFTMDMITLGIKFTPNGIDCGMDYEPHFGSLRGGFSGTDGSSLPQDVRKFGERVFPLMQDGHVVATAVSVGGGSFFVNWHVIVGLAINSDSPGGGGAIVLRTREGKDVRLELENEVAHDVWKAQLVDCALLDGANSSEPVISRPPVAGEEAVVVYANLRGCEFSDPVVVDRVDEGTVCVRRFPQAREGLSGGALISVADGTLLGSYTGSSSDWSLFSMVCEKTVVSSWHSRFADLVSLPKGMASDSGGEQIYDDLKKRGLEGDIREVVAAASPLLHGSVQVGMQFALRNVVHTNVDPTLFPSLCDNRGHGVSFARGGCGGKRRVEVSDTAAVRGRSVKEGEFVFIVFVDTEGTVISEAYRVGWVSGDGVEFRLEGVPSYARVFMRGGVVVALSDASPLGLCKEVLDSTSGEVTHCCAFASVGDGNAGVLRRDELMARLGDRFPALCVRAWTQDDCDNLAAVGDKRSSLYRRFGDNAVATTLMAKLMHECEDSPAAAVASLIEDDLLMVKLSSGLFANAFGTLAAGDARKVDAIKTFFGLVYLREGADALTYVLDELGLFDESRKRLVAQKDVLRPVSM